MSALIAALRAFVTRHIVAPDPYPYEAYGLDLLELSGSIR